MSTSQTVIGIFLILFAAADAYLFWKIWCHETDIKSLRQAVHWKDIADLKASIQEKLRTGKFTEVKSATYSNVTICACPQGDEHDCGELYCPRRIRERDRGTGGEEGNSVREPEIGNIVYFHPHDPNRRQFEWTGTGEQPSLARTDGAALRRFNRGTTRDSEAADTGSAELNRESAEFIQPREETESSGSPSSQADE